MLLVGGAAWAESPGMGSLQSTQSQQANQELCLGAPGSQTAQLRLVREDEDSDSTAAPAAVFRGCYTFLNDCQVTGVYGVAYGFWSWFTCDSRYCINAFGLITDR